MATRESRQARDHLAHGEARGQPDAQYAAQFAGAACGMVGLLECGEDRLDAGEIVRTRFGERDGAGGARKQRGADLALECRGDARDRGLRQAKLTAGAGKASRARDAGEQAEGQ